MNGLALAMLMTFSGGQKGMIGKWQSPCYFTAKDHSVDKSSRTTFLEITEDKFTSETKGYTKADCDRNQANKHSFTLYSESKYELKESEEKSVPVNFTVASIALKYHLKSTVEELNDLEFCGYTDWKVDEKKEISGRKCFEELPALPKIDDPIYDRVSVREQGDGKPARLFFGLEIGRGDQPHAGRKEEDRPKEVLESEYLERLKAL